MQNNLAIPIAASHTSRGRTPCPLCYCARAYRIISIIAKLLHRKRLPFPDALLLSQVHVILVQVQRVLLSTDARTRCSLLKQPTRVSWATRGPRLGSRLRLLPEHSLLLLLRCHLLLLLLRRHHLYLVLLLLLLF